MAILPTPARKTPATSAADDDDSAGAQDADYEPDDGYDSGGDGGFDV